MRLSANTSGASSDLTHDIVNNLTRDTARSVRSRPVAPGDRPSRNALPCASSTGGVSTDQAHSKKGHRGTTSECEDVHATPALPPDLHYVDERGDGFSRRRRSSVAASAQQDTVSSRQTRATQRGDAKAAAKKASAARTDPFDYYDTAGHRIRDADTLTRIRALAIPPAYEAVWICPDPNGHLQAVGRDARGRKQYRYHPRWREIRDANKYDRMLAFGQVLPRIRARVARDMKVRGMTRDKVLATVVRLLDATLIRVGNEGYARENHSFGLTTLRNRHVKIHADNLRFQFRGKSGVQHDVALTDKKVARIVKRCMELPGHELFQYLDDEGKRHAVDSSGINAYLRDASGGEFSAKDYRTWAGSVFALAALRKRPWESLGDARKHVVATVKEIASRLGNTPAVCRRCYVHPAVLEAYEADALQAAMIGEPTGGGLPARGLRRDERALFAFLNALQ